MKTNNKDNRNYSEALNVFLKELPDPRISDQSTIRREFIIRDEKITLEAKKIKGSNGMRWNIKPDPNRKNL